MAELIKEIPDDDCERIQAHCAKGEDYPGQERFAEAEAKFLKAFALAPEPKIFGGACRSWPRCRGLLLVRRLDEAAEHPLEAYRLAGDDSIPHHDPKYRAFRDGLPAFRALQSGAGPT